MGTSEINMKVETNNKKVMEHWSCEKLGEIKKKLLRDLVQYIKYYKCYGVQFMAFYLSENQTNKWKGQQSTLVL